MNNVAINTYTTAEKSIWFGEGEWINEPDEVAFEHEGFKCKILRICLPDGTNGEHIFGGHLCGYVQISEGHPFYKKDKSEIDVDVHGSVTFSNFQKDHLYYIGFDCAHSMDVVPSAEKSRKEFRFKHSYEIPEHLKNHPLFNPTYKNITFCIAECKSLAEQCKAALHEEKND